MKEWQRELLVRDKKIVDETNSKKEALAFYGKYFHKMLIDIHVVLTSNELYNATENITKNIESTKSNFIFCVYAFVALILVYLWQTIIF